MKQAVSLIIPCKNERLNIGPCIESAISIADEVIIADSFSTDNTVAIAKSYPKVRVIQREYVTSGDFKNWAIPQAANEWVLLLDADERATPELLSEISLELSRGSMLDGYRIYRDNHFMGHRVYHGDAKTDSVIRLFRRDVSRYEGPSDHGEVRLQKGRVGTLKERLQHFSAWNYDQLISKYNRYTSLQAQQWAEKNVDTSYFKLLVRPMWRFFREYILQGGFRDGKIGIQQAWLSAFYSFQKQGRLWELHHGLDQPVPQNANYVDVDERRVA
jgi:glycosyltransferase involved in cell wall biosynthesis